MLDRHLTAMLDRLLTAMLDRLLTAMLDRHLTAMLDRHQFSNEFNKVLTVTALTAYRLPPLTAV